MTAKSSSFLPLFTTVVEYTVGLRNRFAVESLHGNVRSGGRWRHYLPRNDVHRPDAVACSSHRRLGGGGVH